MVRHNMKRRRTAVDTGAYRGRSVSGQQSQHIGNPAQISGVGTDLRPADTDVVEHPVVEPGKQPAGPPLLAAGSQPRMKSAAPPH